MPLDHRKTQNDCIFLYLSVIIVIIQQLKLYIETSQTTLLGSIQDGGMKPMLLV